VTNHPISSYDALFEVKRNLVGQNPLNFAFNKAPVFRMHKCHAFLDGRRFAVRCHAVDAKQLGRPVFKTRFVEYPTTHVGQALTFREMKLSPLAFFDIQVDTDPEQ
jgi:hypothetical protein